jgi:hypothetical protein
LSASAVSLELSPQAEISKKEAIKADNVNLFMVKLLGWFVE